MNCSISLGNVPDMSRHIKGCRLQIMIKDIRPSKGQDMDSYIMPGRQRICLVKYRL